MIIYAGWHPTKTNDNLCRMASNKKFKLCRTASDKMIVLCRMASNYPAEIFCWTLSCREYRNFVEYYHNNNYFFFARHCPAEKISYYDYNYHYDLYYYVFTNTDYDCHVIMHD